MEGSFLAGGEVAKFKGSGLSFGFADDNAGFGNFGGIGKFVAKAFF